MTRPNVGEDVVNTHVYALMMRRITFRLFCGNMCKHLILIPFGQESLGSYFRNVIMVCSKVGYSHVHQSMVIPKNEGQNM